MICRNDGEDEVHEIPLEDILAVIIAAKGVYLSLELVRALIETGAIILHCDHKYCPLGITAGIERIIKGDALYNQANSKLKLHDRLWNKIVDSKVNNQTCLLEIYKLNSAFLRRELKRTSVNESACSRFYWNLYFSLFSNETIYRHKSDSEGLNARLDYGYAVLRALLHRSIIVHGLSPVFGIHHIPRYHSHAFVYDLMEPWRPYVDKMLVDYWKISGNKEDMNLWARYVSGKLIEEKIFISGRNFKLLDAVDIFVSGIAKCYHGKTVRYAWMPAL